jgi:hypothetical protein
MSLCTRGKKPPQGGFFAFSTTVSLSGVFFGVP